MIFFVSWWKKCSFLFSLGFWGTDGIHSLTPTHTRTHIYIETVGALAAASDIYSSIVDSVGLDPRLFLCGGGGGRIFKIDAHASHTHTHGTSHYSGPWQLAVSHYVTPRWPVTKNGPTSRRPTGRPLLAVVVHIDDDNAIICMT